MNTQPIGFGGNAPIYVYAIVLACPDDNERFGADAADGRLCTITIGTFAAVVGDGPCADSLGRSRMKLAPQLLAHQRTIERIMRTAPLLPAKFGTVVPDETTVRAVLERGGPAFEAAFSRLDGCVQVEILVKWDVEGVFAEIAGEKAVADLRKELELIVGARDEASCAALGRLVKENLERRRAALAAGLSSGPVVFLFHLCARSWDAESRATAVSGSGQSGGSAIAAKPDRCADADLPRERLCSYSPCGELSQPRRLHDGRLQGN